MPFVLAKYTKSSNILHGQRKTAEGSLLLGNILMHSSIQTAENKPHLCDSKCAHKKALDRSSTKPNRRRKQTSIIHAFRIKNASQVTAWQMVISLHQKACRLRVHISRGVSVNEHSYRQTNRYTRQHANACKQTQGRTHRHTPARD